MDSRFRGNDREPGGDDEEQGAMTMQWGGPIEREATARAATYATEWICTGCGHRGPFSEWSMRDGGLTCPKCGQKNGVRLPKDRARTGERPHPEAQRHGEGASN
jgi:predicted RNA-binding Zn-ribbon protein involved in translation (DUF1610 family)